MATFKDKTGVEWQVSLDAPIVEEVKEKHGIELTNLDRDPLLKLRNDPMVLVAVVYLICQYQIEERGISAKDFGRSLPSPPDEMMEAVKESIVNFSHSGRASHIREALTKYEEMSQKTDELAMAKMSQVMENPDTMKALDRKIDQDIKKAVAEMFRDDSEPGT